MTNKAHELSDQLRMISTSSEIGFSTNSIQHIREERNKTKKHMPNNIDQQQKNYNTYGASLIVHINRTEMKKEKKDHKKKQKKALVSHN